MLIALLGLTFNSQSEPREMWGVLPAASDGLVFLLFAGVRLLIDPFYLCPCVRLLIDPFA
jgi:hypothetical protein